jgi:hypothetical protein
VKKAVILGFILLSGFGVFGQTPAWEGKFIAPDKALHFTYSAAFTMLCIETAKDYPKIFKNPEWSGMAIAYTVVISKELFYDTHGSYKDMVADWAGVTAGIFVNRFVNKQIKKVYKKRNW